MNSPYVSSFILPMTVLGIWMYIKVVLLQDEFLHSHPSFVKLCINMVRRTELDFFNSLELKDKSNLIKLVWQDKRRLYLEIHEKKN